MGILRRWYAQLAVVTRLVVAVAVAMMLVLLLTSAFVFWRVEHGLDRQLDQDLAAYHAIVVQDIQTKGELPDEAPGRWYQVLDPDGKIQAQSVELPLPELATPQTVRDALAGETVSEEHSALFQRARRSYQVQASTIESPAGRHVVVTAISRRHRDEALRELLLQLAFADLLVLAAAAYVGYRTARGALNPVEQYRRAAETAGGKTGERLPVPAERKDELTRLGHTFNDLLGRLEASTAREHQFLADASHELRTPLALLKAEVEFSLHQARTPEQAAETLRSVSAQTDRLVHLADGLLDLEEIDSEEVLRSPVNLGALVVGVAARAEPAFQRAGRKLSTDVPDVIVEISARWFETAISNLVTNALHHGQGDVLVSADVAHGRVRVTVTDQGPGFPAEFVDRAFDRFSRADGSRTGSGSGLGLALVAAVARDHQGTVEIAAAARGGDAVREADGTSVTIDVPDGRSD